MCLTPWDQINKHRPTAKCEDVVVRDEMVSLKLPCIWNVNKELGLVLDIFDHAESI